MSLMVRAFLYTNTLLNAALATKTVASFLFSLFSTLGAAKFAAPIQLGSGDVRHFEITCRSRAQFSIHTRENAAQHRATIFPPLESS